MILTKPTTSIFQRFDSPEVAQRNVVEYLKHQLLEFKQEFGDNLEEVLVQLKSELEVTSNNLKEICTNVYPDSRQFLELLNERTNGLPSKVQRLECLVACDGLGFDFEEELFANKRVSIYNNSLTASVKEKYSNELQKVVKYVIDLKDHFYGFIKDADRRLGVWLDKKGFEFENIEVLEEEFDFGNSYFAKVQTTSGEVVKVNMRWVAGYNIQKLHYRMNCKVVK